MNQMEKVMCEATKKLVKIERILNDFINNAEMTSTECLLQIARVIYLDGEE